MTNPLGAIHAGINFTSAGQVMATAVAQGRRTQAQVNAFAKQMIEHAHNGVITSDEEAILSACAFTGISRKFSGF